MILENGTVRTGDPRLPLARAVAIAGDRIAGGVDVREGDRSAVSPERVDLDGRCVVPGFSDAHLHMVEWALARRRLDLAAAETLDDALAAVERSAAAGDGWIVGHGVRLERFAGQPDRRALDAVAPGRPCAIWAHDHHTLWLSSPALDALGAPDLAVVERDAAGEPSGILREHAAWRAGERIPRLAGAALDEAVVDAMDAANALGVTSVHDYQRSDGLACWQRLGAARRLTLRVWASLPAERLDAIVELGLRTGLGDDWLRIGPVKAFADGTLGSRTAAMLEPFADGGTGVPLMDADELGELVRCASLAGLDVAVHAIGDAANRTTLDAFERHRELWHDAGRRPRIEHCQLLHADDVPRFARLGVTASLQPSHAPSDRSVAERAWGERCDGAYALGSLARSGAVMAFGSDAPIEPVAPLAGVRAAVERDWPAREALTIEQALDGFWNGAAYARHAERRSGTLLPGRDADLVVLERDPVTCPVDELDAIAVVATMVGGRWVHGRPPW